MGAHGCQPLQGVKGFAAICVFRSVNNLGFIREVSHCLLRERGAADVSGDVLHGLIVSGSNSGTAVDIESGVPPRQDKIEYFFRNLALSPEHLEHLVLKHPFLRPRVHSWRNLEPFAPIEDAISANHVAVGVEIEEIPEGLDGDHCPRRGIRIANGCQEDGLKRIPCAPTQFGEKSPVIEEVPPQDLL
jgi:hypothetical protein